MKFRQVNSYKYIGASGFSLYKMKDGSLSILKDNVLTLWGTNFQSVSAAESFLSCHDYNHSDCTSIPITESDVDLIYDMYCSKGNHKFGSRWYINSDFWIQGGYGKLTEDNFNFIQFSCSDGSVYIDADRLVNKLDCVVNSNSINTVDNTEHCIFASKMGSKNTKGLRPQDLMRVKSSNVWAIGVEVSNNNIKEGTVYIQFKGKEGGPGDVYRYYDVPVTLYKRFITAPSFGHFVWKYLRNNFKYSKLTGDKRGKLSNAVN